MSNAPDRLSVVDRVIAFCMTNTIFVLMGVVLLLVIALRVSPFEWHIANFPRDPVPVDAIPDIGENQQIVFTDWHGYSPRHIEDQITYPLVTSLLGLAGVRTIRANSMFGFSSIYIVFNEHVDFYWSRARILEKLDSLPPNLLPAGVTPRLGPDATPLSQVFWYTLEGRDEHNQPVGGWDLDELRTIQDYQVRYALAAVEGVAEVASVGGFVREYHVEVDPDALRTHRVGLMDVVNTVRDSNITVGARTLEINQADYLVRSDGFVKEIEDIANAALRSVNLTPHRVRDVAQVGMGPAQRLGALDREGVETVGGVVAVRYGANPLQVIQRVHEKIAQIAPSLPARTLSDGRTSHVTIVPFYDRTDLIYETLGTLQDALSQQIMVTVLVILLMVFSLRSSILISSLLPLAVLGCFIMMRVWGVDANIVALSGIAIAIGTMVDMGIIMCENILRRLQDATPDEDRSAVVLAAAREVGSAVLTAVSTTIVSFLPVFMMTGAEGKLFKPLAFTKTFALFAAIVLTLTVLPTVARILYQRRSVATRAPARWRNTLWFILQASVVVIVTILLTQHWLPLGPEMSLSSNFVFVIGCIGGLLLLFYIVQWNYAWLLSWCLKFKLLFLMLPVLLVVWGLWAWSGFGREFMPYLDEGSFLFMPSTTPHASISTAVAMMQKQDIAISNIPEVETVVGKIGRVDSPLDPAPIGMVETVILYHPEFLQDQYGRRQRFAFQRDDPDLFRTPDGEPVLAPDGEPYYTRGRFQRDENGALIPSRHGHPFRLWRPALDPDLNPGRQAWTGIRSPDDIWSQILRAGRVPGMTGAEKLQPISTRIVMLQTGIRGTLAVKIGGPTLEAISEAANAIQRVLRSGDAPDIDPSLVNLDRSSGNWKPYLVLEPDRETIARHGLSLRDVQTTFAAAVGGMSAGTAILGRERIPILVRLMRERRDDPDEILRIPVMTATGAQIPLGQLASLRYETGPPMLKSEDAELVGYVFISAKQGTPEVDAAVNVEQYLRDLQTRGELNLPDGVSFALVGTYQNQVRAMQTLRFILPISLLVIFMILHLQFRSVITSLMIFSGIAVAWSGGFILLWLYAQPWFLDFSIGAVSLRDLFQVHTINLSIAVWVGFLALFGLATDDGVVICTYLEQQFHKKKFESIKAIRQATIEAGLRRVRPCLMTTATTVLALLPVLTSRGRGADIMVPMAIPVFGGMLIEVLTMLIVPVLFCMRKERQWLRNTKQR